MTESPSGRGRLGGLVAPALATLAATAILLGLGSWQLERKSWKEGLIAQIQARAYAPPGTVVPEAGWAGWRADDDQFRRVSLEGTLRQDAAVPVLGLAELRGRQATQGVYLFVPLRLDDGSTIIVNRGFVPAEEKAATLARLDTRPERARIAGLVRAPEAKTLFLPANDPAAGTWLVRDIAEMARAKGLERVAPYYIDADATANPGGWPQGGQTPLTLRNQHLEYALTWFGLAATLLGVFAAFAAGRLRPASPEPEADMTGPGDAPGRGA